MIWYGTLKPDAEGGALLALQSLAAGAAVAVGAAGTAGALVLQSLAAGAAVAVGAAGTAGAGGAGGAGCTGGGVRLWSGIA